MSKPYSQPGEKGTDTNQASELFELCKEVAKRTDWLCDEDASDFYFYWEANEGGDFSIRYRNECPYYSKDEYYPLYTSDYLLERLQPFKTEARGNRGDMMPVNAFVFVRRESKNEFRAGHRYNLNGAKYSDGIYADTPLKALLKLTIALSEAGELK